MALIDAELERVRRTDDIEGDEWWQMSTRRFHDGVGTARVVSEQKLWEIKSALIEAHPAVDVPNPRTVPNERHAPRHHKPEEAG